MTDLLIVTDGPDVTADLFAQAAPAFGIGVRVVSLRAERLDLRLDLQATVEIDGLPVTPDIVINRCTANPSGLPSVAALSRQTPGSWSGSFAAAREEQGLVLAAFDAWELAGVEVVNPPAIEARSLMGHWFAIQMAAAGLRLGRRVDETVAVVRGRVAQRPDQSSLGAEALRVCRTVGDIVGAELFEVDLEVGSGDALMPVAWRPRLDLVAHGDGAALAGPILAHLLGIEPSHVPVAAPELFVADLVTNLEEPPRS